MENKIAVVTGGLGAIVSYMFDLVGVAVSILILFMLADYVTGLVAAGINKELNSRIGWTGFIRKLYVLVWVGVVYTLEFAANHYAEFDIFGGYIGDGVAFAYIAIEFISISENGVKMGAPMPPFVKNLLKIVKEKTGLEEVEQK
ncbi:holin family protein [Lysinibacillus sp. BW-2-10]|uniref:phage holin family protein n=1 Tax=Lysinibacillus sp. BW-2-10 TaxID=2590030 RepID=UPI001181044F|nr:phage holin family protein [Lysinibacillus sp. BW-2-10]TSI02377.1 phage holin family protein [Lysinibacillus sp. BW-2-10]